MVRQCSLFFVMLVLLWGCRSTPDITGKWYGRATLTDRSDVAGAQLMALMDAGTLELEMDKDGRFRLNMMGAPIEGSYKIEGDKITLHAEKVMGESIEGSSNPMMLAMASELKEPMIGTLREGGKDLYFPGKAGKSGEADMTFSRQPPPEEKAGPRTVNTPEAVLVGEWEYDPSYVPEKKGTTAQQKAQEFMLGMAKLFSLALKEDNSFKLNMGVPMKGRWSVKNDRLILEVREPEQALAFVEPGKKPEIMARVIGGGKRLLMLNDKTSRVDFALKRK